MKTSNNNKKLIFVKSMSLFILVIFLSTNIFAMNFPDIGKPAVNLKKITIQNYIIGLNSDNEGLRTSCIYFSAQYKIAEASDILKGQFENEQNPKIKLLLFHALNQIGDEMAVLTVKNYLRGITSDNTGLRKSCITFAGKYKISEAIDTLTDQLNIENDPEIHKLISNALFEIRTENVNSNFAENNK